MTLLNFCIELPMATTTHMNWGWEAITVEDSNTLPSCLAPPSLLSSPSTGVRDIDGLLGVI